MAELYKQADNRFTIRCWTELNRHGNVRVRIRYGHRGDTPCTDTAPNEAAGIVKAKGLWKAHLDGLLDPSAVPDPTTITELVNVFVKRPKLSPASVRSYRRCFGPFIEFVGADRPLGHIGRGAIEGWLKSLRCKDISKQSYLRNLSALFKFAKKERYCREDPTADVRIELARAGHTIRPWLEAKDWPAYLAACGAAHRLRSEFVLHVGLRAGELIDCRWDWIHATAGGSALSVPARKSARARAIPLNVRALAVLDEAKAKWGDSGYIFSSSKMSQNNLRNLTVKACGKAGVNLCDFHGLRRSAGANWLRCGVSLLAVSRMLGHSDVSTTARHYAGLSDAHLTSEMAKVNAAFGDAGDDAGPNWPPRQG